MRTFTITCTFVAVFFSAASVARAETPGGLSWARVTEDDRAIKIETDKLEAVIPKKNPKQWMTGIEKGSFLDKTTGFREVGDGLMVIDWLMEAGSDEAWSDQVIAPDGHGVGRYSWYTNETDPASRDYALMAHGSSHRKRMVEGPQLCHRMKPVQPEVIRGKDFVAVKTTYKYEYAAPGRKPGSQWTQLIVFPKGERYFVLDGQDRQRQRLARDVPAQRHAGLRSPREGRHVQRDVPELPERPEGRAHSVERVLHAVSARLEVRLSPRHAQARREHFIRAYHLRDKKTGKDGPWLAGLTLDPSVVYEAWCSQRPGGIIVMIEEIHGKPTKAGESFSAAHIVGYFDTIDDMHKVYDRHKGHTALAADKSGWRLVK